MYRDLLEQMNGQIDFEGTQVVEAPKESSLIDPRRKRDEPTKEYDPLEMMREWMQVIRTSGAEYRKKAIAQNEEALSKMSEQEEILPATKEEPKEEPQETPKEAAKRKVSSIFDGFDIGDESFVLPRYRGANGEHVSLARTIASRNGIPEDLFLTLIQQESGFRHEARSNKGAIGLTQLMPATAKGLGVDPSDPVQNLEGGARYLREQYDRFGRWDLALAAYNAGPGAVEKHGGIPPYKETQNYVRSILR